MKKPAKTKAALLAANAKLRAELKKARAALRGVHRGQTEQQRTAEAWRRAHQSFRAVIDTSPAAIVVVDLDGIVQLWNPSAERLLGVTELEVLGRRVPDSLAGELRQNQELQERLRRGESVAGIEVTLQRKDGATIALNVAAAPLLDSDGKLMGVIGVATDITERKRMEEALRRSEEQYRLMVEAVPIVAWECDAAGLTVRVNQRWLAYTGQTPDEVLGNGWMAALHPDDRGRVMKQVKDDVAGGEIYQTEYRLRRAKDGQYRWQLARALPVKDEQGKIVAWFGCATDIDDQKGAEEVLRRSQEELEALVRQRTGALQESEARYRTLVEEIPAITYIAALDEASTTVYVSPQVETMLGLKVTEYEIDHDIWRKHLHPEDRERVMQEAARSRRDGKPLDAEYRMVRPDGSIVWLRDRAAIVKSEDGQPLFLQGVMTDITDRKAAEEALAESEERYRRLVELAPDAICVVVDGLIKFINTEGVRMTGALDASQIIGQSALRFVHPDHVEMTRQRLNAVVDGQKAPMTELKGLRLDGSEMDLEVTAAPIVYRGKRAAQLVYRDVTERKRLEHAVLEISAREQQRIGQDLHDGLTQHLVGVAYLSQSLQSKLAEKEAAEAADVTRINQLLDDALSQTRHLARGLFPVKLEENGLASSLTELASGIEDIFKMSCRFTCEKSVVVRDNVVATHLYRIAQEAVHNAIRHGQAKVVSIALDRTDNAVTLTVTNDGASFPKELRKGDGMGLDTMAYRARAIGATLDIHGGERGGTVVRCSVPGI